MNLLSPLGRTYGVAADLRNALYDRGIFRSHALGAKTVSVGNITAGGTGKTPLVALVAEILANKGEKVCILTRGYGRKDVTRRVLVSDGKSILTDASTGGDEPVELARKLLEKAVVVADRDRTAAARWALGKFKITAFVLDDGFQHRRAARDLDIVCVDATDPFGGGEMIPAGMLRENPRNLARAGIIVLTRSNLAASTVELHRRLRSLNGSAPIFRASSKISGIVALDDFLNGSARHENKNFTPPLAGAYLFCGLGNPASLKDQMLRENFRLAGFRALADHYKYTQIDIQMIEAEAEAAGAGTLLTTGKDAVKIAKLKFRMPCFVLESEIQISDSTTFVRIITSF